MILNKSYHNILKSPHIARKKVALFWGQKSYFLFFGPNWYSVPGKKKNICYTTRQGLSESLSFDLKWPSVHKKMGGQKFTFSEF
jgi:hypothetical protein